MIAKVDGPEVGDLFRDEARTEITQGWSIYDRLSLSESTRPLESEMSLLGHFLFSVVPERALG